MARTRREGRAAALAGIESLLGADGAAGRIPEVVREGVPVLLWTHWQSLFSDGTYAGLWGLGKLLDRLQKQYGAELAWASCSELAGAQSLGFKTDRGQSRMMRIKMEGRRPRRP
jgi:hypothetical protein